MKINLKIFLSAIIVTSLSKYAFCGECENLKVTNAEICDNQKAGNWTQSESLFLIDLKENYIPESGFTPNICWQGEQWSNISGGLKTGTTWDSLFTLGFEQDLSALTKKDNMGELGFSAFYYVQSGAFSSDYVYSGSDASNIFSGDMFRIFEIYYKNEFDTKIGKIGFRAGQLAADEDFMSLEYSNIFLNCFFGAIPTNAIMQLTNGSLAFSQYALATLGATAFWSNEKYEMIVGVYNGNAGSDESKNHGFDYALQGVALWYQIGYKYSILDLSGKVIFGGNYNSNNFENFLTGTIKRNYYSFYAGIEQDFILDENGNRVLGGFMRLAWSPDESIALYSKYIDLGLNWFSPIPSRESDVFALGFSAAELSKSYESVSDLNCYTTMIEATYRMQVTKAISLQPSFQVYFNTRDENGQTATSYVAGLRVEVNF